MLQDFKKFIMRGNVIDMSVGIVVGAAFTSIVNSFVADLLMPPIGLLTGDLDFSELFFVLKDGKEIPPPYTTIQLAKDVGAVTLNYGLFLTKLISFLIVALAVFLLVRAVNKLTPKPSEVPATPKTKNCPQCCMEIPIDAKRCGHCTSVI